MLSSSRELRDSRLTRNSPATIPNWATGPANHWSVHLLKHEPAHLLTTQLDEPHCRKRQLNKLEVPANQRAWDVPDDRVPATRHFNVHLRPPLHLN